MRNAGDWAIVGVLDGQCDQIPARRDALSLSMTAGGARDDCVESVQNGVLDEQCDSRSFASLRMTAG
jgi:hypothetical protein